MTIVTGDKLIRIRRTRCVDSGHSVKVGAYITYGNNEYAAIAKGSCSKGGANRPWCL
jgi:hypothetical protein